MNADQPARPANIANIVAINQGKKPHTLEEPEARALSVDEVERRVLGGGVIIDTRSQAEFGAEHIPDSLNIQLSSGEFEQRVGWLAAEAAALVLVVNNVDEAERALHKLAFVGLDSLVAGFLKGGITAWSRSRKPTRSIGQATIEELARAIEKDPSVQVLDVREPGEYGAGHIDGAQQLSFKQIPGRVQDLALNPAHEVYVVCATGMRSSTANSLLLRAGFEHPINVNGGMKAWLSAGYPRVAGA